MIKEFKKLKLSGKKIYTYAKNISNQNYLLASISDIIVMPDTLNARVDLEGYYRDNIFYKDILNKYGVKFEVIHIGSHKSFGEEYYSDKLSEESKFDKQRVLDNRLNVFIENISKNRDIDKEKLKNSILSGEYSSISAYDAFDHLLIDELDDYKDFLENIGSNENNTVDIYDIITQKHNNSNNEIAIINLEGDIVDSDENIELHISESNFEDKLSKVENNANVKAVIIRINSPGGDAYQAELIHKQIMKFKEHHNIPVYISISDVAASGGYYIASAGDKIFANEASITGSIGVVTMIPKFVDTLNKFNIHNDVIQKGKFTGIYEPFYNLTDEDRKHIKGVLEDIYFEFKLRVSTSRKISDEELEKIAGGRIWLGNEAVKNGLVDGILSLSEVIDMIVNKDLKLDNYYVKEYNSDLDYISKLSKFKNYIAVPDAYKKLQFFSKISGKPMYYNYDMNEIKF